MRTSAREEETRLPGQVRKVVVLLMAFFVPVLGPMVAVALGVYRLDPGASAVVRRDGRELVAVGLILFMLHLFVVGSVMSALGDGPAGGHFEIR